MPMKQVNTKVKELGEFIRSQRSGAQMSLRKLAKVAGVSNPYLSQVERGLRHPSAEILQAIAKALRVSSQTLYVKAGILEESPHPDVHTAVMGDPTLTEQQKQVLLQVYDSFRVETGRGRKPAAKPKLKTSPKATTKTKAANSTRATAGTAVRKISTARSGIGTTARRSTKLGGRTEMQADPSPHPAPLRPPAANVRTPSPRRPRKEVG
jgi:transcriptional regulator with XRE-family HTH domain